MNLETQAKAVLDENWRGGYTVPSRRLYPFQWNWDSGFVALGLAWHRPERAIEEIRSQFAGQWANGFLPHIVFHRPDPNYFPGPQVWATRGAAGGPPAIPTSGITQPPVFAFVVERIAGLPFGGTQAWRNFEREIFPRILAFHRHLYAHRDPLGEGLVCIHHNWEAGTDNSPVWDAILGSIDLARTRDVSALRRDTASADSRHRPTDENYRRYLFLVDLFVRHGYRDEAIAAESPFLVQDVLFNSLLAKSNTALLSLARRLGEPTAEIEAWTAKTAGAINAKLWDPDAGFYFAYDVRNARPIRVKTSSGFMPLFAGVCGAEQAGRLAWHLEHSFGGNAGWRLCPSAALDEPGFDPIRYWRGPAWANLNWMLHHGLQRAGRNDLAARVRRDTLDLLGEAGLFEYFDARPAAIHGGRASGLGADRFSWSAALSLDLLNDPRPA